MPKYQEIANILRTRIKNKTYPPDSLLPNQIDLVEEFQVSRMTIKKAIGILSAVTDLRLVVPAIVARV